MIQGAVNLWFTAFFLVFILALFLKTKKHPCHYFVIGMFLID